METLSRRTVNIGLATLASSLATFGRVNAQPAWPTKQVNIVIGFAAGGFSDSITRQIARKLAEQWKQPVVVQNMPGAGGNIAARHVSMAAPDGYTLLSTTTGLAINETLSKDKGFSVTSLAPIAIPVAAPELLASDPKAGIKTMTDALAAARAGKLFMGSAGIGSGSHISAEYFFRMLAKVEVKHIPFPGGNPAKMALLQGDVNIMASTSTVISSIISGELAGIAVGSEKRTALLPNVPTYAELGYPGFTSSSWGGFFAPKGTPASVLDAINGAVNSTLEDAGSRDLFQKMGIEVKAASRAETERYFNSEVQRWSEMVKAIGLQG